MDRFFERLKNIGIAILVWGAIFFVGFELFGMAYVNWWQPAHDGTLKVPDVSKAAYEIAIPANGRMLYSNKVSQDGAIITLDGYFTLEQGQWRYRKNTLELDQRNFGSIMVMPRR